MSVLDLVEWQHAPLGPDAEAIARLVIAAHDSKFDIQEPSRLTGQDWAIRSRGLVGYLPLGDGHALRIAPKVSIRSLLAMLDLAPDLDSLDWHEGVTVEGTVEGLFDVLAMLLARKVANRVRKGLHRAYIEERDELQAARGRILPRETLARRLRGATGLVCDFETLTDDLIDNQILLWTLERLRRSSLGSPEVRREVRSSHRLLAASLSLVPVRPEDCVREYHQLNGDYRPLHALCRLLLEACGSALTEGSPESIPFTIWMPTLFERYIARWLARELRDVLVDDHVAIKLADGLSYDADVVLRDRTTRAPSLSSTPSTRTATSPSPATSSRSSSTPPPSAAPRRCWSTHARSLRSTSRPARSTSARSASISPSCRRATRRRFYPGPRASPSRPRDRNRQLRWSPPMKDTPQLREVALASHGLEFLSEAVQRLARDTDEKDARFAVVHIAVGSELMLKARLVQEHWSLVFDKGKTPSRKRFSSGDFKSITPEQCIEYLAEAVGVTLSASASKALLELAHARNRIVHFAAPPKREALRIIAFRALTETADFIATELELSPEDEGTLAMINAELRKLKEYLDKRLIVIGPKLRELGDDVYWCPRCTHRTLQSPHPVACLLCLEDFGAIQEVYEYQIERVAGQSAERNKDWGDCPRCRVPFAVRTDRARSTLRCMSCKIEFEPSDMITCPTCDEWFSATNEHCPYCAPQAGTP